MFKDGWSNIILWGLCISYIKLLCWWYCLVKLWGCEYLMSVWLDLVCLRGSLKGMNIIIIGLS